MDDSRARIGPRGWISIAAYHAVFLIVLTVYGPFMLWRNLVQPRYRGGLRQRLGFVPPSRGSRPVVWVHGVSVGEVKAAGTLLAALREQRPDVEVVLSATTPTGHHVARLDNADLRVVYYPLDFGPVPGRALDRIRPVCVLLMELELWPNFLTAARRRGVRVAVVNGRISEKTFHGYRRVRWLLPQLDWIASFCVQDRVYRQRLLDLGIDPGRIHVTGNVKYDSVLLDLDRDRVDGLRSWLSGDGRPVVVAGSTHGDEDLWVARAVRGVGGRAGVRLVSVPRKPERVGALIEQLGARGIPCVRWSECEGAERVLGPEDVLVVDTVGHLRSFYAASDVAFVGGSLVTHGGQNMLEPAALGKPVVFGPHTTNFRTDVERLLAADAAVEVADAAGLERALGHLLGDRDARTALGARARDFILGNRGATGRTMECLERLLPPYTPPARSSGHVPPEGVAVPDGRAGDAASASGQGQQDQETEGKDRQRDGGPSHRSSG